MNNNAKLLEQHKKALEQTFREFVTVMGVEAKNHSIKSFKNGGFTDQALSIWKKRKIEDAGRAVLVKSGDLRKSIRIFKKTSNSITIGSSLKYAKIHNEGGNGLAYGKYPFKMPKRQFIGHSAQLNRKLLNKLKIRIKKVFS